MDWKLLDLALTHSTVSPEENYEQLEFVGDAVVRLAVAEFLLEHYSNLPVGEFAAIRSVLVSDRQLAEFAAAYNLDHYLLVAEHTRRDEMGRESRLAESFEAMLGALYLSTHSLELIRPWLNRHLKEQVTIVLTDPARQNYKAALQEWTQGHHKALPEYRIQEQKDAYGSETRFYAEVWFQGQQLGQGSGRTIKAAEQAAAREAYLALPE